MNSVATDRPEPINRTAAESARARAEAGYARRDRERFTIDEKLEDARLDARAVRAETARASNRPAAEDTRVRPAIREAAAQGPDQAATARGATVASRESTAGADEPARPERAARAKSRESGKADEPAAETTEGASPAEVTALAAKDASAATGQRAEAAAPAEKAEPEAAEKGDEPTPDTERTTTAVVATPPPTPAAPPAAAQAETAATPGPARPSTGEAGKVVAPSAAAGEDRVRAAQAAQADGAKATASPDAAPAPAEAVPFASLLAVAPPQTRAAAPAVRETARSGAGPAEAGVGPATPMRAVPIEIGLRALDGTSRFDIRLDPVELGRIDVRLDIDQDSKQVKAHLTVDRVETLQLLQRDAGLLEQAFVQAGLTPSPDGLGLSLRDAGGDRSGAGQDGADRRGARAGQTQSQPDETTPAARPTVRVRTGLDIRI